jgi:hypothetical protein
VVVATGAEALMKGSRTGVMVLALAALAPAAGVSGQQVEPDLANRPVVVFGGVSGQYARTVGEFRDYVRGGVGLNLELVWPVVTGSPLALRGDGGFIVYGSERSRVCLGGGVGCRIELDLTTTNSIAYLSVGPQLMLQSGAVRPYANAGVGFAYFGTSSDVRGSGGQQDSFASTTNFDDVTFQWGGGGGLLIPLGRGATPVMLDLGARYHGNGRVEYLREGDIEDLPDGSLVFTPTRSEANLVTFRIGIVAGVRRSAR